MNNDCLSMILLMSHYNVVLKNTQFKILKVDDYFYRLLGLRDYKKIFILIYKKCLTDATFYAAYNMCISIGKAKQGIKNLTVQEINKFYVNYFNPENDIVTVYKNSINVTIIIMINMIIETLL